MQNYDSLIDSSGVIHDRQSGSVRMRYGAGFAHAAFPDFSLRNLGFIEVRMRGSGAHVKAAPGKVGPLAYTTLLKLLSDLNPDRVALQWYDGVWHEELFGSTMAALKRFVSLMLTSNVATEEPFYKDPVDSEKLDESSSLSKLLGFWKDKGGKVSIAKHEEELNQIGEAKFAIIKRKPYSPHLIAEHYGKGMNLYPSSGWRERLMGRRVDEQPDLAFGRWVADTFRDAMIVNEPTAARFDVTTYDPKSRLRVRKIYTRLSLPIEDSAILSGSIIHNSTILNAEFGDEPK